MRLLKSCIPITVALSLGACQTTGSIKTTSMQVVIGWDNSYIAASKAGQDLVTLGKLDAVTYHDLNRKAYLALTALRAAQTAGTTADIATATANLAIAIAAIYAIKGN